MNLTSTITAEASRTPSRKEAKLPDNLEKHLKAYVLAAGAAGAILAATNSADADIITTTGITYEIRTDNYWTSQPLLMVNYNTVLRFVGYGGFDGSSLNFSERVFALMSANGITGRLGKGVKIGPGMQFGGDVTLGSGYEIRFGYRTYYGQSIFYTRGNFRSFGSGYVGFRFLEDGKPHYGWAHAQKGRAYLGNSISLTGSIDTIAYDTVAGQPILTGQTATPEPATLGLLALGAAGLAFWRNRKQKAPSVDDV